MTRTDADERRTRGIWPARPMAPFEPLPPPRSSYVLRSLVRATAFRVLRQAPLWFALAILLIGFVLERSGR
jgi:hypothetical protein